MEKHRTSAPVLPEASQESMIIKQPGSLFYRSTLSRGGKEETEKYYNQVSDALKQCLGNQFEYTSATNENGLEHLDCTGIASTKGENIRNLNYMGDNLKPELPKYVISLYITTRDVDGKTLYEIVMDVSNRFCQY